MKVPMSKAEAAKINFSIGSEDMFGKELGPTIAKALKNHFRHLTNEDEACSVHVEDGRLSIELSPIFGFDDDPASPTHGCGPTLMSFSLVALVRDTLEFGLFATSEGTRADPLKWLNAGNFRSELQECIEMIDYVERKYGTRQDS